MSKGRLEAFSDGVIAIIITIMVLELEVPEGAHLQALAPLVPEVLIYALSFVYLGIYWNNHHHLLQAAERINGGILWANLHLLFWLSPALYAAAIPLAFVNQWIPLGLYVLVALIWLVPDRRIESTLHAERV
jgi:uncharacterized membrane protein